MRTRLLEWLFQLTARHGGRLLVVIGLATLVSAALLPGLRLTSSYSDLAPEDSPEELLYRSFQEDFGSANDFVIVLDGDPAASARQAADLLAAEIKKDREMVSDVYYRVDLDQFLKSAPLYLDLAALEAGFGRVSEFESALKTILRDTANLPALTEVLAKGFRGEISGTAGLKPDQAIQGLESVRLFLAEWRRWIEEPERTEFGFDGIALDESGELGGLMSLLKSGGYLASHDGGMHFLFVRPALASDDLPYLERVDGVLKRAWETVRDGHPKITGDLTFAITGLPAHILTDVGSVRSDVTRVIIPSAVLVVAILLAGLRSIRKAILALVTLTCALVISAAFMRVTFGTLNRVSAGFLAILFGIGIDFSIYLIRRTDEEVKAGAGPVEAVRKALTKSGRGILTGGLVTGLAFFSTSFVENEGLAQMGQTAGLGVLITLLVTFLLLPVLLMKFGGNANSEKMAVAASPGAGTPGSRDQPPPAAHGSRRIAAFGAFALAILLLPAVFGAVAAARLPFDYNILRLLPREAESTLYQLRMHEESDFQMSAAFVTADSFEEMREMEAKLSALPEVSRVVSLTQLIPREQDSKLALLRENREFLQSIDLRWEPDESIDAAGYARRLGDLGDALEGIEEAAFSTGNTALLAAAGQCLDSLAPIRSAFRDAPDPVIALTRTGAFEAGLFRLAIKSAGLARRWATLEPVEESTLPLSFLSRFKGKSGRYAAYVYPNGSIWELEVLDRFVKRVREITPDLTGFPVALRTNVRLMVEGLVQALLFSIGVVVVLLAADFRSARKVILTLVPLVLGMLWLQAWIRLTGQVYNLASMIGLPLLLGLGVVYGVHIVHRWSENPAAGGFSAVKTSGLAIALAALTTIAGLVSLTFSLHRGLTTFSLVLLQGILLMLAAALTALPLLLNSRWVRIPEERSSEAEPS